MIDAKRLSGLSGRDCSVLVRRDGFARSGGDRVSGSSSMAIMRAQTFNGVGGLGALRATKWTWS